MALKNTVLAHFSGGFDLNRAKLQRMLRIRGFPLNNDRENCPKQCLFCPPLRTIFQRNASFCMKPFICAIFLALSCTTGVLAGTDLSDSKNPPESAPAAQESGILRLQSTDKDAVLAAVGKEVVITGKVRRANAWDGGITFLNLDGGFTVVCFRKNFAKFPSPLEQLFSQGKTVQVTGKIRLHKDRPEIEITGPEQIEIVEDAAPAENEKNGGGKAAPGKK